MNERKKGLTSKSHPLQAVSKGPRFLFLSCTHLPTRPYLHCPVRDPTSLPPGIGLRQVVIVDIFWHIEFSEIAEHSGIYCFILLAPPAAISVPADRGSKLGSGRG